MRTVDEKLRALVVEAGRWVGVREVGVNHGPEVEAFQRAVDGKAQGEPWCAAFVQFCLKAVDARLPELPTWSFASESVLTIWNRTTMLARRQTLDVLPGDLMLWQHFIAGKPSAQGHIGVVARLISPGKFETIEGNTSDGSGVTREGDGVYRRVRDVVGSGSMRVKGFIRPWGIVPAV